MAILNAAESKVAFCAKYGITITEDEWLPMVFRRYSMDNGEGKNKLTMSTIDEMQSGAAYGSSRKPSKVPSSLPRTGGADWAGASGPFDPGDGEPVTAV